MVDVSRVTIPVVHGVKKNIFSDVRGKICGKELCHLSVEEKHSTNSIKKVADTNINMHN